ncbi:hypothetical protein LguiB_013406 [Lonicera macranthoides]
MGHASSVVVAFLWEAPGRTKRPSVVLDEPVVLIQAEATTGLKESFARLAMGAAISEMADDFFFGAMIKKWVVDKATKNIKALDLHFGEDGVRACLGGEEFRMLRNLRQLTLDHADLNGDFEHLLPNLRWLRLRSCSLGFMPTNFYLKNLVVLSLKISSLTDDWECWSQIKMSKKLKILKLSRCNLLTRIPNLSAFSSLERLEVKYCDSFCNLDEIEEFESLRYLNALHCQSLRRLPNLSKLRMLKKLNVSECRNLIEIPGLDKLESLEGLFMKHCVSIVRLPNLSNLQKLNRLDVLGCRKLIEIKGLEKSGPLGYLRKSSYTFIRAYKICES